METFDTAKRLYDKLVAAYLEAALVSFKIEDDAEARGEFRVAFGRDPKALTQAVRRFPETYNANLNPDLYDILATLALARVKDDNDAQKLFEKYTKSHSYEDLREQIKEYQASLSSPKKEKPRKVIFCKSCGAKNDV